MVFSFPRDQNPNQNSSLWSLIYNHGQNSLGQSCKTGNYRWFDHYSQMQCYVLKLCYMYPLPNPFQCWWSEKIAGMFFNILWGGGRNGPSVLWISCESLFCACLKSHKCTIVPRILSMILVLPVGIQGLLRKLSYCFRNVWPFVSF